jgi:hypothetical protein
MPAALGATRMTGIAWSPGRFLAGAVTEATSSGGLLLELSDDSTLQLGVTRPFTSGTAAPVVGSSGATIALAGAVDRVAVAWVDLQSAHRVITVAALPLGTGTATTSVAASASTMTNRYYPHVVFDGASFTVAWLEASSGVSDSQIVIRRFDTNLTPVGTPLSVGVGASVGLGDFGLTAAGPNVYGVATAISGGTQRLFVITCT